MGLMLLPTLTTYIDEIGYINGPSGWTKKAKFRVQSTALFDPFDSFLGGAILASGQL